MLAAKNLQIARGKDYILSIGYGSSSSIDRSTLFTTYRTSYKDPKRANESAEEMLIVIHRQTNPPR